MGTWNSTILADDDAQDIYAHYCRLVNNGQDFSTARQGLERSWADTLADADRSVLFRPANPQMPRRPNEGQGLLGQQ